MTRTVILQAEPAECGLACLAMVASHHGMVLPLRELRRRFPLSLKGASLSRLLDVARRLGLEDDSPCHMTGSYNRPIAIP